MEPENLVIFILALVIIGGASYLFINRAALSEQIRDLDESLKGEKDGFERLDSSGSSEIKYRWRFKGKEWEWSAKVDLDQYSDFKQNRDERKEHWFYVTKRGEDEVMGELVSVFMEAAEEERFDPYERVNFVVSFVQQMPYTSDKATTGFDDYTRYPLETLVDGGGDCEDTSILAASILQEMGYGVVLLHFPNHMAVGVLGSSELTGKRYVYGNGLYYYLETSGSWKIGEVPEEYKDVVPEIITLEAKPVLSIEWSSKISEYYAENATYLINVGVGNTGTADAKGCLFEVAFDSKTGKPYSYEKLTNQLFPKEKVSYKIVRLTVDRGLETSIRVGVSCQNHHELEKSSAWQTS